MSDTEALEIHVRNLENLVMDFREALAHDGCITEHAHECVAFGAGTDNHATRRKHEKAMMALRKRAFDLTKHRVDKGTEGKQGKQ